MSLNPKCGLLTSLIDYAGLFPPASLGLPDAVSNYSRYRRGSHSAMLGRFIVPIADLAQLAAAIRDSEPDGTFWEVSVLVGKDVAGGLSRIAEALAKHLEAPPIQVRSIEAVANGREAMHVTLPPNVEAYFEIDHRGDPREWVEAAASAGVGAKIRTGGVEPAAFPKTEEIARFLLACARERVPFKATAGLHHPFPAVYPLTYEEDSLHGAMHGFMNVFFAATLAWRGLEDLPEICAILDATTPPRWDSESQELCWLQHCLKMADLTESRAFFARSYGSCSFLEPIQGLEEASLL